MAEVTLPELYKALKEGDPQAFRSGGWLGSGKKRWVLSTDTVREIAALQGTPLGEDQEGPSVGYLLGLPFRVDDAVDRFALERVE